MQIGGKDVVKYVCGYGVETKTFKMTQIQKIHLSMPIYFGMG